MITGHALPRRTFLRGMGTAVALPFLDAMTPAFAAPATPITRVAFVYTANGVIMSDWTPRHEGARFAFTKTLQIILCRIESDGRTARERARIDPTHSLGSNRDNPHSQMPIILNPPHQGRPAPRQPARNQLKREAQG
ncbi:MAG TPA: hypothetical protein EYQ83_07325, partial [Acidobacteria bacterium]|nr:hypothetical protein [Acidobacteriota bacterium]